MRGPSVLFHGTARVVSQGPSFSGKSVHLFKVLKNANTLFENPPQKCFFFYRVHQPLYERMEMELKDFIVFRQGMPSREDILAIAKEGDYFKIICVDDQGGDIGPEIADLFQIYAHHHRLHCFVLLHRIFTPHNKFIRDLTINSSHLILRRNVRDGNEVRTLFRQFGGQKAKGYMAAFQKATGENPYAYVILNLQPECKDQYRLYGRQLPEEAPPVFYIVS